MFDEDNFDNEDIKRFLNFLKNNDLNIKDNGKNLIKKRFAFLVATQLFSGESSLKFIEWDIIKANIRQIFEAFKKANVYILIKGELENYLPSYKGDPFNITNNTKLKTFHDELQ